MNLILGTQIFKQLRSVVNYSHTNVYFFPITIYFLLQLLLQIVMSACQAHISCRYLFNYYRREHPHTHPYVPSSCRHPMHFWALFVF